MAIDVNAIEQTVEVTAVGDEVNVNIIDQPVLVSVTDQIIEVEASGGTGPQGPAGAGVAAGGTTGQVLSKASNTNYDTVWVDAGAGTVYSVDASGSTGISVTGGPITGAGTLTITNTAPDQVVVLTQGGTTTISGTYPNFTISSADQYTGTVTSVNMTVPTGLTISGNPITSAGTLALALASGYTIPTQALLDSKVPYIGATGNVDLGEYELKAGQLTLDVSPTGTASVGTTRWNNTIGSSETTLKGGNVVLKNGVDLVARVVNKVTPNTTLTKAAYQAVRVSGAAGQRLAVAYAQANNDNNSADTIGLVCETIATNQEGFIITVGQLEDINTTGSLQGETWADGDVLYLSPTTPGAITNVKPAAPQHLVVIGYVEYAHANHGKIYVKVMNGWELGELHDVNTTGAVNGSVLKYNGSIWVPSSDTGITSLNGLTALSQTFATGTSGTDFNISSASSTHTFNLPTASSVNRGLLSAYDWTSFDAKIDGSGTASYLPLFNGTKTLTNSSIQQNGTLGLIFNTNADLGSSYLFRNNSVSYPLYYSIDFINYASPKAVKHYYSSGIVINEIGGTGFVSRIFNNGNHIIGNGTTDNGYKLEVQGTGRVTGTLTIDTINNATTDTDKFLVSDAGVIKYRTGAELLSDIGGQASGNYITALTGEVTATGPGSASATLLNSAVTGKVLTGLNLTGGGTILATDSILQAFGKTQNQISALVGGVMYEGVWNANTNSPAIVSGVGNKGDYYVVNVAGSTNIDGISDWKVGDWIIFNGTNWDKVDNTDAVSSVNGFTGAVNLTTANISEVTNLYFTDARVMAAMLTGYTIGSNTAITFNDSVLTAFGKAQAQINTKQNIITLTTTGSSGSATFISDTLNVPTYTLNGLGGVPTTRTLTINGTAYDLSADRTWNVGTITTAIATTGGQVAFFNGATVITSVTGLYFDGVDKLGIGNSSPAYNLDVTGDTRMISSSSSQTLYLQNSGTGYGLYNQADSYFQGDVEFQSVTSTLLKVDASHKLIAAVAGTDYQAPITNPVTGTGTTNYLPKWTSGSALGNSVVYDDGTNVGIGTISPSSKLHVVSTNQLLHQYTGSPATFAWGQYNTSGDASINNLASANLLFATNNTERARFTSSGNLLVNSTFDNGNCLQVNGDGYFSGNVSIANTTSSFRLSVFKTAAGIQDTIELQNVNQNIGVVDGVRLRLREFNIESSSTYGFSDNTLTIGHSTNKQITLTQSGNLGLSVVPSAWSGQKALDFDYGGLSIGTALGTELSGNAYYNGTNWIYKYSSEASRYEQAGGQHRFLTAPSGTASTAISFTQAMTLNASGNLGLAVVPSAWGSGYKAIQAGSQSAFVGHSGNFTWVSTNALFGASSNTYIESGYATTYRQTDGTHAFFNAPSGTAGNAITFTQAMTLTSGGNLLVGTTTDNGAKFQVDGTGYFSSTLTLGGGSRLAAVAGNGLNFYTGGADRMNLDTSGNLGVGTSSPGEKIELAGANVGISINGTTSSRTYYNRSGNYIWSTGLRVGDTNYYIYDERVGARLIINDSGSLGIGVVPSAWDAAFKVFQIGLTSLYTESSVASKFGNNIYYSSGNKYYQNGEASQYVQQFGTHAWFTAPSGTAGNAISFTQAMTLTSGGNLLVGGTVDYGYKVNISGLTNIGGNLYLSGVEFAASDGSANYIKTGSTLYYQSGSTTVATLSNTGAATFSSSVTAKGDLFIWGNNAAQAGYIAANSANGGIYIAASGTNQNIRIVPSGTGIVQSIGNFDVTGTGTFSSSVTATNGVLLGGNSDVLNFKFSSGYGNTSLATIFDSSADAGNHLIFKINNAAGTATERMRIVGNGNVGIGTTSPIYKFEVSDGTRTGVFNPNSSLDGFFIGTYQAKPLIFGTGDNEKMRITSGGNLLVGTTTDSGERLVVSGSAKVSDATPILTINGTTTSIPFGVEFRASGLDGYIKHTPLTGLLNIASGRSVGWGGFITFTTDTVERMRIKSDGIINISNVPSSATGLSAGDIYKDASGFLKIV